MNENTLQNERGAMAVLRALMLAFAEQMPAAAAAGLANAQRLREGVVNSRQPDAFLAGLDAELAFWTARLGSPPA